MKNSSSNKQIFIALIAALLIFLFVYTSVSKLSDIQNFRFVISTSPVLKKLATFLSFFIPITELLISVLLIMPAFRIHGFAFSMALLAVFTFYIAFMLLYAPHLPCSCGGVIQQMTWKQHLIFNSAFIILSWLGWKLENTLNKNFIAINRQSRTPV